MVLKIIKRNSFDVFSSSNSTSNSTSLTLTNALSDSLSRILSPSLIGQVSVLCGHTVKCSLSDPQSYLLDQVIIMSNDTVKCSLSDPQSYLMDQVFIVSNDTVKWSLSEPQSYLMDQVIIMSNDTSLTNPLPSLSSLITAFLINLMQGFCLPWLVCSPPHPESEPVWLLDVYIRSLENSKTSASICLGQHPVIFDFDQSRITFL